jgi:hypothetical protein
MTHDHSPMPENGNQYFVYDPTGFPHFHFFATEAERDRFAGEIVQLFLRQGLWDHEVEGVMCGKITHVAQQTNIVDKSEAVDGQHPDGRPWPEGCDFTCDYVAAPLADPASPSSIISICAAYAAGKNQPHGANPYSPGSPEHEACEVGINNRFEVENRQVKVAA